MQSPYTSGSNVGSNWGPPPGYMEALHQPGQIQADAMNYSSQAISKGFLDMMAKYEEGKKTSQQSKALQNAIKSISENEGMDGKFVQASTAMRPDETPYEHLQRMKMISSYVMQSAHDKENNQPRMQQRPRDLNPYLGGVFGAPSQSYGGNGGMVNPSQIPQNDLAFPQQNELMGTDLNMGYGGDVLPPL